MTHLFVAMSFNKSGGNSCTIFAFDDGILNSNALVPIWKNIRWCLFLDKKVVLDGYLILKKIHTYSNFVLKESSSPVEFVLDCCKTSSLARFKTHSIQFRQENIFFEHLGLFLSETSRFSLFKSILKHKRSTGTHCLLEDKQSLRKHSLPCIHCRLKGCEIGSKTHCLLFGVVL